MLLVIFSEEKNLTGKDFNAALKDATEPLEKMGNAAERAAERFFAIHLDPKVGAMKNRADAMAAVGAITDVEAAEQNLKQRQDVILARSLFKRQTR